MSGLSQEDHGKLNSLLSPTWAQDVVDCRRRYAGDEKAQRQIDTYAGEPAYNDHLSRYVDALKRGDTGRQAELEQWFAEHGYAGL